MDIAHGNPLDKQEEIFKLLFSAASDSIFLHTVSPDGTQGMFIEVNETACRRLGYSREELLSMSLRDILSPGGIENGPGVVDELWDKERITFEAILTARDGSGIPVEISSHRLLLDAQRVILSIARDIGDRKASDEDLKQKNRELDRLSKELARSNKELEQFAYIASHDLQEPLRMVASYVQLLAKRYGGQLGQDADDFIAFAVDGAYRMQTMINDLLIYSQLRRQGEKFEPVDCNLVIDQTLNNLGLAIGDNSAVITFDPLPIVQADQSQLVQLFQNLIGNALKYRSEENPRIHISVREEEEYWVFSVADNGIGLEPESAERIFVIFQRLHSRTEYPGTGIGLALCKRIVQQHGGRIWVDTEPGQGSTFFFTLPVVKVAKL